MIGVKNTIHRQGTLRADGRSEQAGENYVTETFRAQPLDRLTTRTLLTLVQQHEWSRNHPRHCAIDESSEP